MAKKMAGRSIKITTEMMSALARIKFYDYAVFQILVHVIWCRLFRTFAASKKNFFEVLFGTKFDRPDEHDGTKTRDIEK